MAGTSDQVTREMERVLRAVARERDALSLEIVHQLSQKPPDGTPVRTGWARANWIPVLGAVVLNADTTRASSSAAASGKARQAAAIALLATAGSSRPDVSVHVYNPVPYVNSLNQPVASEGGIGAQHGVRIERGHSRQSAPGWVERSIDRAIQVRRQASVNRATVST